LKTLSKKLRILTVTVGAIGALAAIAASPAMAEQIPAKASATNIGITATNITVKKNGAEAKNCELAEKFAAGPIEGGFWAKIRNVGDIYYQTRLTCAGGTKFSMDLYFSELLYDTTTGQYLLRAEAGLEGPFESPWGQYRGGAFVPVGTWTNGSGVTNSTITFPESTVGLQDIGGAKISFSGTFTAKTASGGLITLSH
jgi:hypothetical protein